MKELHKMLIDKNITLDNLKQTTIYNNISKKDLEKTSFLIHTINNLINFIELRVDLTKEEVQCIQTIKENID